MEEVGAQVAAPIVIHHTLSGGRFCNTTHPVPKKRGPSFQPSDFAQQNPSDNWNPKSWDWDSSSFVAKPVQGAGARVGNGAQIQPDLQGKKEVQNNRNRDPRKPDDRMEVDDENLCLKLGGGDGTGSSDCSGPNNPVEEPPNVARPNKRVRSGSPGGANYPMCQVDNCKEDLSTAKDYHRRHKVCEVHSKASKALVGKQMQRFCQQCSRFHPLSEFDEGKRSCRRRLAGHNRRRRKTQPEDTGPRLMVPGSNENNASCDMDIVNLLTVLARAQGNTEDKSGKSPSIPDKDQLIQILSKINSLPLPANLAAKLPLLKCGNNGSKPSVVTSENQNRANGNTSSPSTRDLLAVLSAARGMPASDAFETQSQPSTEGSDSEKSKSACVDQSSRPNLQKQPILEYPSVTRERSSPSHHSPMEDVDCHVQETSQNFPLQLFSSSPEDDSIRKLPSCRNYFSSESSNPSADRTPISSPVVHDLFPMQSAREMIKQDRVSNSEGEIAYEKATTSNGCSTSLQLYGGPMHAMENGSIQSSPYQAGYTSSSGSDHSPPSLNSDAQDRTGRIIFKLFDKDPSHLPGALRSQIYKWLSNSPSEMESYIRPGCVVLSLYLSMPSIAWEHLEENLFNYVKSLVKDSDEDFWGTGRFLVLTDRKMATHQDGKIRLCKSWRAPELISVSPVAVIGGQETSILLRGRSLAAPGTKVHCTHAAGFDIKEVPTTLGQDTTYDEISLNSFKIHQETSRLLGRCFIEVENGFRGTSFPLIIADKNICQELRLLEPEIDCTAEVCDGIQNASRSREEVLHFLHELGWLFQRKHNSSLFERPYYRVTRFKFLLIFSVEHDFCALVKTLLGILLELNMGREGLASQSLEMLSEIHLLNRAVKRRCRSMVDLLIHYSITDSEDSSEKFIFLPNMAGPGGVTPLHLAASTSGSDNLVDALTNDPQELGLNCWNSVLDANGLSPYAYAVMRNNHSYNTLVARKHSDRKNGQVSVVIENEIEQLQLVDNIDKTMSRFSKGQNSCSRCAVAAAHAYRKRFPGSTGLLQRPYIHSMLVVAAVCVCVCLFLRGHPYVGCVAPFAWENLGYGSI